MILDKKSFNFLKKNIKKIKCNLTLLLILKSIFDMVRDARYRGTEFLDFLLKNNFFYDLKNNIQILNACFELIDKTIKLIPFTFKNEYKNKIYNECEKMLKNCEKDIGYILKKNLIKYSTQKNIRKLKMIYEDCHPFLTLKLENNESWEILFKIYQFGSSYSEKQKKILLNYMEEKDSGNKKKWLLAIEGLTENNDKLEELWRIYLKKNIIENENVKNYQLSYEEIKYSLKGFISNRKYFKHKYLKKFFEELPFYLKNNHQFRDEFFNIGFLDWENTDYLIEQLNLILEKLDDNQESSKFDIRKKISFLKNFKKCCYLYEN